MDKSKVYENEIPDDSHFKEIREIWRAEMGADEALRAEAIGLTVASNAYNYGYQWEWCGVPIIRHPDDIVLQQEVMWEIKPKKIIETGIARGGSLVLSASLQKLFSEEGKVLGIDIQILDHTNKSLAPWVETNQISMIECDSTSAIAKTAVTEFIGDDVEANLLVLDSNHSHDHVLNELLNLAPLLNKGSFVIVADTIIQEMPENSYENRPWNKEANPLSAVNEFLRLNPSFERDSKYCRRSLMGECRDGILRKIKN